MGLKSTTGTLLDIPKQGEMEDTIYTALEDIGFSPLDIDVQLVEQLSTLLPDSIEDYTEWDLSMKLHDLARGLEEISRIKTIKTTSLKIAKLRLTHYERVLKTSYKGLSKEDRKDKIGSDIRILKTEQNIIIIEGVVDYLEHIEKVFNKNFASISRAITAKGQDISKGTRLANTAQVKRIR